MVEPVLKFGPFELFPVQRQLLADGQPVRLGSRALDILIVLTRHAGEVLTKDQLIAAVWPGMTVEEANLRVNIAALRKVLGDGVNGRRFIASITGRGYSFVAPIAESRPGLESPPPQPAPAEPPPGTGSLPLPLTRVLGRADVVRALVTQLPQRRIVTIVGAGGIGKTTVALTAAESMAPCCRDGAVFVDLARVEDPLLVPTAVAAALGCAPRGNSVVKSLESTLRDKALLLVLDSRRTRGRAAGSCRLRRCATA